jgi:hypothetical protein
VLADLASRLHPERGRPHVGGWEVCREHRQYIADHIGNGVCLTKVRKLLRRQRGVQVSYATLRRFAIAELGWGVLPRWELSCPTLGHRPPAKSLGRTATPVKEPGL